MQLPVLLQALTGCAGCLLNRRQGGHGRSERCGVEKNLSPLSGLKPWTVTRVAAVDATITTLLDISIKPSGGVRTKKSWGGGREQGSRRGCHATHQHTNCTADSTSRLSVYAASHPDVAAAPACRLIVPTGSTRTDATTHQRFHGVKRNMLRHVMSRETLNMKRLQARKRYTRQRNSITAIFFARSDLPLHTPKQKLLQQNKIHCPKHKQTRWQCVEITPLLPSANKIRTHFGGHVLGIVLGTSTVCFTSLSLATARTMFSGILRFCESPAEEALRRSMVSE